jgi:hypothetical protein
MEKEAKKNYIATTPKPENFEVPTKVDAKKGSGLMGKEGNAAAAAAGLGQEKRMLGDDSYGDEEAARAEKRARL